MRPGRHRGCVRKMRVCTTRERERTEKGRKGEGRNCYLSGRKTGHNKQVFIVLIVVKLSMDPDLVAAIIEPISPGLAACHFVRGPTRQINPSRCSKCGYSLLYGTSHTRIVRKTKQCSSYLQRSCPTCGHVNNTLLQPVCRETTRASPLVTPRIPGTDQSLPPDPPPPVPPSCTSSHLHSPLDPTPLAHTRPQPLTKSRKSRSKHKAGLREILARSKAGQHEATDRGPSGLAKFLHSL